MSKFEPLEAYLPEPGRYELLPFRFERINELEVVITNAVGEFVFLERAKLDQLVARQLSL